MSRRRILVTSALPYANGHIHIGHLVEYLQTDIWVRFQRSRGHECRYFCADDTHGAPIMLSARKEGVTETEFIERMSAVHQRDFAGFGIRFDHYGSTHSAANRTLCGEVWHSLREAGIVSESDIEQLYDTEQGLFLADRFVQGGCPRCGAPDQFGDNCETCGATYNATELKAPRSTLSGSTPEVREAAHLFVQLEQQHAFLDGWTQTPGNLKPETAKYLKNFFLNNPLRDWDISRPAPYFGFEIPDSPGNYWYVWFDAPIGYIATTQEWCDASQQKLGDWWKSDDTEIVHVIGKDIVYFHTLFWPVMLKLAGYNLPKHVHVHGFLTVNGEKMAKRKGTQINASTYLEHLDPAYLRFYYASKLGPGSDDLDLDLDDFAQKVNSTLLAKVINLASRSARFIQNTGLSASYPEDEGLFEAGRRAGEEIAEAYEQFDYARAMRLIMGLADRANEYIDRKQPWTLKKEPGKASEVQDICTVCLNLFRQLAVYLAPTLPELAAKSSELLHAPIASWSDADAPALGHPIGKFSHLMQRLDPTHVQAMVAASIEAQPEPTTSAAFDDDGAALAAEPLSEQCTIDDFMKVDLRVARVIEAKPVKAAKKLLELTVSLGGTETRTVFAGIKEAYAAETLVGRLVVVVANLKPRAMTFGTSEGMVIAAGPGGQEVYVLAPDSGAKPGQRVH
jgi:methionyl-tRNA synthetase